MGYIYERWGYQPTHYYGAFSFSNELEHYGVKGMKWYQHKFGKVDSRAKYGAKGGRFIRRDEEDKAAFRKFQEESEDEDDYDTYQKFAEYQRKKYGEVSDTTAQALRDRARYRSADAEDARKSRGDYTDDDYTDSSWRTGRRNQTKYDPDTFRRLMQNSMSDVNKAGRKLSDDPSAFDDDIDEAFDDYLRSRRNRQAKGKQVSSDPMDDFARGLMRKQRQKMEGLTEREAADIPDDEIDDDLARMDANSSKYRDRWDSAARDRQRAASQRAYEGRYAGDSEADRAADQARSQAYARALSGRSTGQTPDWEEIQSQAESEAERRRREVVARAQARAAANNRSRGL